MGWIWADGGFEARDFTSSVAGAGGEGWDDRDARCRLAQYSRERNGESSIPPDKRLAAPTHPQDAVISSRLAHTSTVDRDTCTGGADELPCKLDSRSHGLPRGGEGDSPDAASGLWNEVRQLVR